MNADREEQEDELLALHSIFDSEEFVRDESKYAGEIRASVELPAGFTVVLKEGETVRQDEISFLPPLRLTFELPKDYPSSSPPSFTLTCSWLTNTQLSALSDQLTDLYLATGGDVVLFSWVQFLKEDALSFVDIHSQLELPSDEHSIVPDLSAPSLGDGDPTGIPPDGQNRSTSDRSSKDSQEDEAQDQNNSTSYLGKVGQNGLDSGLDEKPSTDSNQISEASDEREAEQTLETSELKPPPLAESDQSGEEDILNGGDSSASLLPPSTSSQPPDPSEESGAASLPVAPKDPPQNEYQTPCGLSLTPSQALLSELLIYDATQRQKEFATTVFDCGVCYVGWLGLDCVQLPGCGHIFCRACLGVFFKVQITEGNVQGVTCLDADCSAAPIPAQVRSLVGEELFSRYDRLLLQMTLDSMSDVVYCPRRTCGLAVIMEKSSKAAMCSVCNFAFCVACRKTYHGTDDCEGEKNTKKQTQEGPQGQNTLPQSQEGLKALWDDYANGSKMRKKVLESRYGRNRLLYTMEECLSEDWIAFNSKNCPYCFCRIQKISGCNTMTCSKCRRRFCWACLTKLPESHSHFSDHPDCVSYL
uniref:E3 ubiquitin-protein ligase RNF14-like n=1 Tax=Semicossyphus pulcher TaxID=241346 RepID=UPI0037E8C117